MPNPYPQREYEVECVCPEFTCVCPMTGQPDFATFTISYVPGPKIVELKSLKLYLWSFREEGHFHEDVTNRVLDDLVHTLDPRRMSVISVWNVRGGNLSALTWNGTVRDWSASTARYSVTASLSAIPGRRGGARKTR